MNKAEIRKMSKMIFVIALPMVVQGFVFQIQSLTDKIFLGNIKTIYLSAMGAAQFPLGTTMDTLFAICIGITVVVSQLSGDGKKVVNVLRSAVFYNSIVSWALFIMWFFFSKNVLKLMSVDELLMNYSSSYIKICCIYFLVAGIDASMQATLQGLGKTKPIMYAGIIKVVINVILDYILIFGKLGIKPLGIEGAAIATLIANISSCVLVFAYTMSQTKALTGRTVINIFSIKFSLYKDTIKIGIPAGMELFLWNGSNLVLVKFLNSISYLATTIYTLTFSVEVVIYNIFSSIGKAGMTLQGRYIGQGDKETAKKLVKICMAYSFMIVGLAIAIFLAVPRPIIGLFTKKNEVISSTVPLVVKMGVGVVGIYITIIVDEIIRATLNCYHYFKGKIVNHVNVGDLA